MYLGKECDTMDNIISSCIPKIYGYDHFCVSAVQQLLNEILAVSPSLTYFPEVFVFSSNDHSELMNFSRLFTNGNPLIIIAPDMYRSLFSNIPGLKNAKFIDLRSSISDFRQALILIRDSLTNIAPTRKLFRYSIPLRYVELQILHLLKNGNSLSEISKITGISYRQVSQHKRNSMRALGVSSNQALYQKFSLLHKINEHRLR